MMQAEGLAGIVPAGIVAGGLALAFVAPFAARRFGPSAFFGLALYPTVAFAWFASSWETVWAVPWVSGAGVELAFRLDGLSRVFALLITGLGTLILVYAGGYFKARPNLGRFAGAFVGFMAAMLGLVLSDDAILLFVFWELTSVTSYLLIGFDHESAESRASAQQAFLLTVVGGLAMLAGFVLLSFETGTLRLSEMGPLAASTPFAVPIFLLVFAGCATKSAQVPFHFWLPNAMAAPTPVSAYLHSATMVKAGVFLLARMRPVFEGLPLWGPVLGGFGAATAVTAFTLLLTHRDAKKLLAYTTLAALGTLVFLLGQPGEKPLKAFVALLVGHALYKGALFLVAGSLDKATKTRDVLVIGGLGGRMPWTAAGALAASLSAFGFVGTLGFQGKEYAIKSASDAVAWAVVWAFALGTGIVATRVGVQAFLGTATSHPEAADVPWSMRLGPLALGLGGVALGVGVGGAGPALLNPMASAVSGRAAEFSWHAFPPVDAALVVGLALAGVSVILGWVFRPMFADLGFGLDRAWRVGVAGLPSAAARVTALVQPRLLRDNVALLFALVTACTFVTLAATGDGIVPPGFSEAGPFEWAIALLAAATAVAVVFAPRRVSAICMLGIVGTGVALIFLTHGAPDLALTQLLTDLLLIVIAVLVFYRLPKFRSLSSGWVRVRDALIALSFGGVMATLALAVQGSPRSAHVADFYASASVEKAYGRNVVNTILVDFRAMDTLGEATVLVLAAIGVFAMMHLRPQKEIP